MRMGIDAVIFDMDGIIFDSERLILDCWGKVGEKHQLVGVREVLIKCIGTNKVKTDEILYQHYGKLYEKYAQEASQIFHAYVDENGLPVKKGARELLQFLKDEKVPVGMASSTRKAAVEAELKQAGLYDYFQSITGGDQLERSKPEPDIYLMACEKMGIEPQYIYAIEDSHNGIRAAYRAGMMPIMVPDILPATEEMRKMSVEVFGDLLQVKAYFQRKMALEA